MIKIAVKVQLKQEVLDTRGRSILKRIQKDSSLVQECRYGKYIELSIEGKDSKEALSEAEKIAKNMLCNNLIENFELEVLN